MADKRISQLVDRGTVANSDVVPIVVSGASTTNKATISSIQTFMQGNLDLGVTSVGITLGSSGTDVSVSGSPVTSSGNITINIPDASATARGVVTTGTQTFAGYKIFNGTIGVNNDLQLATVGTALNTFIKNINATGQTSIGSNGFGFNNANNIYFSGSSKGGGIFAFSNTGNQTYTLQDASGTLAFTSDIPANTVTGTGAANQVAFWNSGSSISGENNLYWDATNNRLGINESSPDHSLHVVSSQQCPALFQSSTSGGGIALMDSTTTNDASVGIGAFGDALCFRSGGDADGNMRLHANGNLTIGGNLSDDGYKLDVRGNADITGALNGTSANFSGSVGIGTNTPEGSGLTVASGGILVSLDPGAARKVLELYATSTGAKLSSSYVGASSYGNLELLTSGLARLTIADTGGVTLTGALNGTSASFSGNLVLGTTALSGGGAAQWLTANGTPYGGGLISSVGGVAKAYYYYDNATNAATVQGAAGVGVMLLANNVPALTIASTGAATFSSSVQGSRFFSVGSLNGTDGSFYIDHPGTQTWKIGITNSNTSTFSIGNDNGGAFATKVLNITNAGNVGIGTASPARTLDVNGSARANNFASIKDRVSVPSSTFTTFFTPSLTGLYLARVYLSGNNSQFWSAVIIFEFNASTILVVNQTNGINVSTNVSGTDIQVRQIGGSTFDFDFEIIRIG
jgi:hypothetical protein